MSPIGLVFFSWLELEIGVPHSLNTGANVQGPCSGMENVGRQEAPQHTEAHETPSPEVEERAERAVVVYSWSRRASTPPSTTETQERRG